MKAVEFHSWNPESQVILSDLCHWHAVENRYTQYTINIHNMRWIYTICNKYTQYTINIHNIP